MKKIKLPLENPNEIENLKAGDVVLLTGVIYTARDAAHKRLVNLLEKEKKLPIELLNSAIYYVGPTPSKEGEVIGSAGPTSSYRMDTYCEPLLKQGLKIMIGKGSRSSEYKKLLKSYKAVYISSIGGCGLLIKESVKEASIICYEDLGAEAIYKLVVEDFYGIVTYDSMGGDLFDEGIKKYQKQGLVCEE